MPIHKVQMMRNTPPFEDSVSSNFLPDITVANLKLCPLCDSLNAKSNQCCFVCGWTGKFINDCKKLRSSLVILLEQCPDLAYSVKVKVAKPKPTWQQLWTLFKRTFFSCGKLDLKA